MQRHTKLFLTAVLLMCASSVYAASDVPDGLGKAIELYKRGDKSGAGAQLELVAETLWEESTMELRNACFIKEKPTGYGLYSPRENNIFNVGEHLLVYFEPKNFSHKAEGVMYEVLLNLDFAVMNEKNTVLGGQRDFSNFHFTSRAKNRELMIDVDLGIEGIRPGKYRVQLTARDGFSNKSASTVLDFVEQEATTQPEGAAKPR